MRRILFVDDEQPVLEGLRDALRPFRRDWKMTFASSGGQALDRLGEEPFDVIVSDMRMPEMDGATLLARVQAEHPSVVRIALSGYAETEQALKAASVAHVFLAKPCDVHKLHRTIERAASLQTLLIDQTLLRIVGGAATLPSVPSVYLELVEALGDQATGSEEVARIVERDTAMTAKVLQLVNSAFFGLGRPVTTVAEAVTYLGMATVKSLVLSASATGVFAANGVDRVFPIERHQEHSLQVARIAVRLDPEPGMHDTLLTASLLHDVGKLLLASADDAFFEAALLTGAREGTPLFEVEARDRRVTHAEIGAYLLGEWGLPHEIVEAVAHHHAPARASATTTTAATLVHVADALAHEASPLAGQTAPPVDEGHLELVGVHGRLEDWRRIAAEVTGAEAES